MSAKGHRHVGRVKSLPCVLCKHLGFDAWPPSDAHHIREGQGAAQRADDMLTAALCKEHHQGASGVHGLGTKGFYARYKLDELDLLALTLEALET
jgi:hypothetical protein